MRRHSRDARVLLLCLTLLAPSTGAAQLAPQPALADSRFADLGGLRLEYFEFGNADGPPVIMLQDFHDYFRLEEAAGWRAHLARFGDRYRILAPVRRGYGASDDPRWGFDVSTQADDIIRFLNAMGIQRAVLVGRVPATQEMTWLAEHHPERLAGLVFIEYPIMMTDMRDPELRAWAEAFWRGACDLGDRAVDITGPRTAWQPHFLSDTARRIAVPAAVLTFPPFAGNMDIRFLGMLTPETAGQSCSPESRTYYQALAADTAAIARLRQKLAAADRSDALKDGMARAFGSLLRVVEYTDLGSGQGIPTPWYVHTRAFLDMLADRGTWR